MDGGSSLGRCFFATKRIRSLSQSMFAKKHRHFDRLSDRVAADEFVCKEASALESPLDARLRVQGPPFDRSLDVALRVQGPRCGTRSMSCKGMPSHIRHPELDSGSVEVVAVCVTDPESSSGCRLGWRFFVGVKFFFAAWQGTRMSSLHQVSV